MADEPSFWVHYLKAERRYEECTDPNCKLDSHAFVEKVA